MRTTICGLLLLSCCVGVLSAADDLLSVLERQDYLGGWAVHLGADDGAVERTLAALPATTSTGLALDGAAARRCRAALTEAGLLGSVSVHAFLAHERLPFHDRTLALLVADPSALGDRWPGEAEALRVLRPGGLLLTGGPGAWQVTVKDPDPRLGDWTHYNGDASGGEYTADALVGPGRSVRWLSGDNTQASKNGLLSASGVLLSVERGDANPRLSRLVARDGFSGAELWRVDGVHFPYRHGLLLDHERVYLHALFDGSPHASIEVTDAFGQRQRVADPQPRPMIALNLETGAEVLRYDQGLQVPTVQEGPGRYVLHTALSEGLLVQVFEQELAVLEAASGRLLWHHREDEAAMLLPRVLDGRLFVIRARTFWSDRIGYLPGTPSVVAEAVMAFELKTGRQLWHSVPPTLVDFPGITFVASGEDTLALQCFATLANPSKQQVTFAHVGDTRLLALDAATGEERWAVDNQKSKVILAGGHFFRPAVAHGLVWQTGPSGGIGYSLEDGSEQQRFVGGNFRCSTARFTEHWQIASQRFTSLVDGSHVFTEAYRSNCDTGLFPANGMVYSHLGSGCECLAFIRSLGGYAAARLPLEPWVGERTEAGPGRPATGATVDAEAPGSAWPIFMRDRARSNWTEARLPTTEEAAWTVAPPPPLASDRIARSAAHHEFIFWPVTAPVVAEDTVIVADTHRGRVRALSPADGSQRWQTIVDGRLETAPTIHRGAVYFGTRSGWVYALARDDGQVIWRTLVAPHQNYILDHAQAESSWPVFASLVIVDGKVWAAAGRNSELDNGIRLVALDPTSGDTVGAWSMGEVAERHQSLGAGGSAVPGWATSRGQKRRMDSDYGRVKSTNSLLMSDGEAVLTERLGVSLAGEPVDFVKADGTLRQLVQPPSNMAGLLRPHNGNRGQPKYGPVWAVQHAFSGDIVYQADGDLRRTRVTDWQQPEGGTKKYTAGKFKDEWKAQIKSPNRYHSLAYEPAGVNVLVRTADGLLVGNETDAQLDIHALENGARRRSITLPAPPVQHGVAVIDGLIVVTCTDGSVVGVR